ncbi:MAG: NAD(P)-dependent oxidoreductase, partial [Saprospiraceae bacterium]
YGNNGSAFGRLWHGWNVRVLAYDKYLESYGSEKVIPVELSSLLEQADIISLHIPLTPETLGMVNHEFISKCKKRFVLINTSRGKVVDLDALLDGLRSEHLRGACLDVLPTEPPSSGTDDYQMKMEELYRMDNVVLSPHVAGWSVESKMRIAEIILQKLQSRK